MSRTRLDQQADNQRLRKDLVQAKAQIQDLQEELEEKTSLYLNAVKDRKQHQDKLSQAREQINKVDSIVKQKVKDALQGERLQLEKLKKENANLQAAVKHLQIENDTLQTERDRFREQTKELTSNLGDKLSTITDRTLLTRLDTLRADKALVDKKVLDLLSEINTVTVTVSDLTMENKQIRKMANIPENYGVDLNSIKLHDKEKIEDFKRLIKVLQDDNYKLEDERARLKHAVKTQAIISHGNYAGKPFGDLSPEQHERLDEFVRQLRQNDPVLTGSDCYTLKKENEKLQAQMDILNSNGYDLIKNQLDAFFKEKGGMIGQAGPTDNYAQKKVEGQITQIMSSLNQLMNRPMGGAFNGGGGGAKGGDALADSNKSYFQGMKVPNPQHFNGKYEDVLLPKMGNSVVKTSDGKGGVGVNNYEQAFLQGQVQELIELVYRKDEDMKSKQQEIFQQNERIRQFLLTQEELYKDLIRCEQTHAKKEKSTIERMRNSQALLLEETTKCELLEKTVSAVQGGDSSLRSKIIDLTKQFSISEVNLLRLTRKYQALEEQEKLLRRDYHNKDADMAEKDYFVQQRINDLKEWKARAVCQLDQLFKKLRKAVPQVQFDELKKEHELQTQNLNDVIISKNKLVSQLNKQHHHQRVAEEVEVTKGLLGEQNEQLQAELEYMRKRLEHWDDSFKWENEIFRKIAQTLMRAKVSPQTAFAEFDDDGSGTLEKPEFQNALQKLQIFDLSVTEIDTLWNAIDNDGSNSICYHEFIRKLERFGVTNRSQDETVIYQMMEAAKKTGMNLAKLFEMIDKRGNGIISREDFEDVFKNLNLTVETKSLESFIDTFWKGSKAGIDYKQFLAIFKKYEVRQEQEDRALKSGTHYVSDSIIRLKKQKYDQINQVMIHNKTNVQQLFKAVDADGQGDIDKNELRQMFNKMGFTDLTQSQVEEIFESIDFDQSGDISLPEFQADFQHFISNSVEVLINEEHNRKSTADAKLAQETIMQGRRKETTPAEIKVIQMQTKIDVGESREKQLNKKVQQIQKILDVSDNARREFHESNDALEDQISLFRQENLILKGKNKELGTELTQCIRKDEHQSNMQQKDELVTELTETRAAMLSYKSMHNVIGEQVKALKFAAERKKDEQDNLFEALREMQSDGVTQERLGKLYFVIMLSRWQEAAVNKKYTDSLMECKELRNQMQSYKSQLQQREDMCMANEESIVELTRRANAAQHELDKTKGAYITQNRVMEFQKIIQDLADSKTDLEEEYMHSKRSEKEAKAKNQENVIKAQQYEELHNQLKKGSQSDISNKLIELSHQLYKVRLGEYRALAENEELRSNETHLKRLLERKEDALKAIENKAASDEKALIQEQELFRNRDNERVRKYANKFEEAPQFGHNVGGYGGQGNVMQNIGKAASMTKSFDRSAPKSNLDHSKFNTGFGGGGGFDGHGGTGKFGAHGAGSTGAPNSNAELLLETNRLKEENGSLHQEIHGMEAKIKRMEAWNTNDQYLSYEDEAVKDAIDKNRDQMFAQNDQDRSEMAGAAQKAVQTLQVMLDQKNQVLHQKEEFIRKLKISHEESSRNAQEEISGLRRELTLTGTSALGRMRDIIDKHDIHAKASVPVKAKSQSQFAEKSIQEIQLQMDKKDDQIKSLSRQQVMYNESREKFKTKIGQLEEQNQRLKDDLTIASRKTDFQRAQREVMVLREEGAKKDKNQGRLQKLIDNLNSKMMKYESEKLEGEDTKKKQDVLQSTAASGHTKLIANEQMKTRIAVAATNAKNEELANIQVKFNELETQRTDNEAKVKKAQADAFKLQGETDQMRTNMTRRDNEIEDLKARLRRAETGAGGEGPSKIDLQRQNTELTRDNAKLKVSQIQVVAPNTQLGTFEWIGEAQPLSSQPLKSMDEILSNLKRHFTDHHRITFAPIFHSLDKGAGGSAVKTISYPLFLQGMERCGIHLQAPEIEVIKGFLDPNNNKRLTYETLVFELQGLPQKTFVNASVQIIARTAEARPIVSRMDLESFLQQLPAMVKERDLVQVLPQIRDRDFTYSEQDCKSLMRYMCNMGATGQVTSMQTFKKEDLIEKILLGVEGIIVQRIQDSLRESNLFLPDLLNKYGRARQGCLSRKEFNDGLLIELKVNIESNVMTEIVYGRLLMNAENITNDQLMYLFGVGKHSSRPQAGGQPSAMEREESKSKPGRGKTTTTVNKKGETVTETDHVIPEDDLAAKAAARKVLDAFAQSLQVELHKMDKDNEGMVQTAELKAKIIDYQIKNLTTSEVDVLLNICDSRGYGVVVIANFIEKLQSLAQETEYEAKLRWFAMTVGHQGINLRMELGRFDSRKAGTVNLQSFKKAIKGMSLAQTDLEIDKLFKSGYKACSNNTGGQGTIMDIKTFCDLVAQKAREPPPKSFLKIGQQPGSKTSGGKAGSKTSTFETWELEKKYKKNLDALKDTIVEKSQAIMTAQNKENDANKRVLKLEVELQRFEERLIGQNAKTCAEASKQSRTLGQLDEVQKLNDQVFHLQEVNKSLQKTIRVDLKMDLGDMQMKKEQLEEENKKLKEKLKEKTFEIGQIASQKAGRSDDFNRQSLDTKRIRELESDIRRLEEDRDDLEKQLSEEAQLTLELKFEKEGVDLKFARLQKRIQDLEQFKMESSSLSAELKNQREEELKRIEEESGKLSKEHLTKKQGDSVKIKPKKHKTAQELELVVESLRRVIEKQMVEMDQLKTQNGKLGTLVSKKSNEPAMLLKISDLEAQLETFLKQETNQEDFQRTIKKMVQANKFLREDLDTETTRYRLLEDKYAKIMVEYKLAQKEMQRNEKLIFQTQAGANIENNLDFLEEDEDDLFKFGDKLGGAYGQRKRQ